jgi:short-subunit dehydrogenase
MSDRPVALVTGASAGIGQALANVFAENGHDLVLVARRRERLEALAAALKERHGADSVVLPADLADPAAPERIFEETERAGITVDVLVNNAGYGVEPFTRTGWRTQADFLQVLLTSVCHLTHLYLPGMRQRDRGRILNVASLAAFAPVRSGDLYAPIKTYVVRFTEAIDQELKERGGNVRCTASCPGFTYTEFHDVMEIRDQVSTIPKFMWQTADQVAREAYEACMAGRTVVVHGGFNRFAAWLMPKLPRWAVKLLSPKGSLDRWSAEEEKAGSRDL